MNLSALLLGLAVVVGMTAGQVLLKLAARRSSLAETLFASEFWAALAVYGLVCLVWIVLLRRTELSRAYPFVAATFVLVPGAAVLVLGETVGPLYAVGAVMIVIGIVFTAWS